MKRSKIIITILLLSLFIQCIFSIAHKSPTDDEPTHITAGYSIYKRFDFRPNREHPPVTKLIAGFPLIFLNPKLIVSEQEDKELTTSIKKQYTISEHFFYRDNNDPDTILFASRFMFILLSLILGYYVFLFAKDLYGTKPALFALFLYSFSPNIIAHSRIVHTDIPLTLFCFATIYHLRKYLLHKQNKQLILTGIFFGLSQATKFTALVMIPIIILTIIAYYIKDKQLIKPISWTQIIKLFLIGFIVLLATYLIIQFPYYISGFKYQLSRGGSPAFLLGERSLTGWWYYYIIAFLLKTPIPTLILIILSFISFKKAKHNEITNEYILLIPILLFHIFLFINPINIGLRYILPTYPFIFVFVSKFFKIRNLRFIVSALGIWYIVSAILIYPNYLAYFNEYSGGKGYNYLLDSNIDWGQDLKQLKTYLDKNNIDHVYLGYFGKDNATFRKINYNQITCVPIKGYSAASVNFLFGLVEQYEDCLDWLKRYEPIEKIGNTIFVYNISEPTEQDVHNDFAELEQFLKKQGIKTAKLGTLNTFSYTSEQIQQLKCKKEKGTVIMYTNFLLDLDQEKAECYKWIKQYNHKLKIGESFYLYEID